MVDELKVMAVGDDNSGKIKLLQSICRYAMPDQSNQSIIYEGYHVTTVSPSSNEHFLMSLWDISGQEDYTTLRRSQYNDVDLFLMCFSLTNITSLSNIRYKWHQEIYEMRPQAKIILVGTKSEKERRISTSEGLELKRLLGASGYVECSYKTDEGIELLIHEISKHKPIKHKHTTCSII